MIHRYRVPILVKRLITEQNRWDAVFLKEKETFRVGHVNKLIKDDYHHWKQKLAAALKYGNVGAVLLILDGDIKKVGSSVFCAASVARTLAHEAKTLGAGNLFSVAIVFALQEYETWLIAGVESMANKRLQDGRTIAAEARLQMVTLRKIHATPRVV